jgi:hypothetical protein
VTTANSAALRAVTPAGYGSGALGAAEPGDPQPQSRRQMSCIRTPMMVAIPAISAIPAPTCMPSNSKISWSESRVAVFELSQDLVVVCIYFLSRASCRYQRITTRLSVPTLPGHDLLLKDVGCRQC